ncbi:MAG: putative peptidoglycan glycosyltransferase FtsW [Actinomycetaceae bacterium]|nr:putative peptidoglycan glycosyltransferase FtsW [Actinomycetaceae bacterium]MDY5853927.1 putative peptidoglycan glycosyltransferase FtsW [Arcanobacterium sp.]
MRDNEHSPRLRSAHSQARGFKVPHSSDSRRRVSAAAQRPTRGEKAAQPSRRKRSRLLLADPADAPRLDAVAAERTENRAGAGATPDARMVGERTAGLRTSDARTSGVRTASATGDVTAAGSITAARGATAELTDVQKQRRDAVIRGVIAVVSATAVLIVLGIIMVFSATSARSIGTFAIEGGSGLVFSVALRQMLWVAISIGVALILSFLPYYWVERCSYWLLGLGLVLQLAVLLFGITSNGNTNWLGIGPVQVQPSEFLKAAMVVWLAHVLARLQLDEVHSPITLLIPALGFGLATLVVLLGWDMGTALIYVLIGGGMVWLAGMRGRYLVAVGAFGAFGAALLVAAQPYRLRRVEDFFANFFAMPDIVEPTQVEFAQFAFGSGGVAGVGLGAGKEKWGDLAEAHTDFIFAVIGEELGLFGTLTVVALFLLLGWGFVQLAQNMNTRYGQLVTVGAGLWICGQAILNMCVVTGVLPVFGVPLPFLSQGGSSMLGVLIIEGVVISCARSVPGVREALSIKSKFVRKARAVVRS